MRTVSAAPVSAAPPGLTSAAAGLNMASNMAIDPPESCRCGASMPSLVLGLSDSEGVVRDASAGSAARVGESAPDGSGDSCWGEEAAAPASSGGVAVANASSNIASELEESPRSTVEGEPSAMCAQGATVPRQFATWGGRQRIHLPEVHAPP